MGARASWAVWLGAFALFVGAPVGPWRAAVAGAAPAGRHGPPANAAPSAPPLASRHGQTADTAPSAPPLSTDQPAGVGAAGEEAVSPAGEADPLVANGLGSPSCEGEIGGELSSTARRNCQTSGFVAAPAATGDYGLDVHIDTGLLGLGSGAIWSAVQDLIVAPLWMALVWAVHALVVMLEWCFTLDLLDSSATVGLGGALRAMQASFTEPWLAIALACASMLALYHGIVRRRVAQTLGETALMVAMMVGGLWVISDPRGSVGALGQWADQASLGTLAVAAHGSPARPGRALADSFGALFESAIEAPWCYLEFGDVAWCREPSRLDPRLRAAAQEIAREELAQLSCTRPSEALGLCTNVTGASARALAHSAELLRGARTNGAIFLALPANGAARNSINDQGSLLRALCQSSEATDCRGSTAAEAEFRTASNTMARLGGLVLIAAGLFGMLLLLCFLGLRLLLSAVFSLLCLLLAPAIVIAPAFGEGGRALFRRWGGQLLEAAVAKLVFAFLLGAVLGVLAIISQLSALGWWTQWLLMSAFWWGAFARRHQALGLAHATAPDVAGAAERSRRRSFARRLGEALETPRLGLGVARAARARLAKPAPEVALGRRAQAGTQLAREGVEEQVERVLEHEQREAQSRSARASAIQRELASGRRRLARLEHERARALSAGDSRRAARLAHRGALLGARMRQREQALSEAQQVTRAHDRAQRRTGARFDRQRRDAHALFLDEQARLPAGGRAAADGGRRDYARLAGLAGLAPAEYERLDPVGRRAARMEIDRELALRQELRDTASSLAADAVAKRGAPTLGRRERERADRQFEDAVRRSMHRRGHGMPVSRHDSGSLERWRDGARGKGEPSARSVQESSVMRDAFEVAARRKRQLGRDRP